MTPRRAALFALVSCLVSATAIAHAFLDHAQPAVGSTLHDSPHEVRLWFTEPLEAAFSHVHVEDDAGRTVDAGDSRVETSDRMVLVVGLPPLSPGAYRVVWRVVSVDTHVTEGDFTFTVAK